MSGTSLVHRIALGMIPGVGDITARKLVAYAGSPEAVFSESHRSLTRIPGVGDSLAKAISGRIYLAAAEKEAEFVEKHQIKAISTLMTTIPTACGSVKTPPSPSIIRAMPT